MWYWLENEFEPYILNSEERIKCNLFNSVVVPIGKVCSDVNVELNQVSLPGEILIQVNLHP